MGGEAIFVNWDLEQPGITFSAKYGRILIFKRTLDLLGFPECYRFLFSPEDRLFAVQACRISDEGAHNLPPESVEGDYRVRSMDLVQFVYRVCGWNDKVSYRAAGVIVPEEKAVQFDLSSALELYEGRLIKH